MTNYQNEDIKKGFDRLAQIKPDSKKIAGDLQRVRESLLNLNVQNANQSQAKRLTLWKIIMKNRITKYATAAVILIGVMVGLNVMNGSPDGAGIVWADTLAVFQSQDWVHIKYDKSGEIWVSLNEGKTFVKNEKSVLIYDRNGNSTTYLLSKPNVIIIQGNPMRFLEGYQKPAPWERKTAWEYAIGQLETEAGKGRFKNKDVEQYGKTQYEEIETKMDFIDNVELVRFDRYVIDAMNKKILRSQVWADPSTRLPVKIREYFLNSFERTGLFDFPKSGPENIYDLGAPRDAKIINHLKQAPANTITETHEAAWKAYRNMPDQYRALVWDNNGGGNVHVVYRNNDKIHAETFYHHHVLNKDNKLAPRSTAQKVLDWIKTQSAVYVFLSDGIKDYHQKNPHPLEPDRPVPVITLNHMAKWKGMPIWNFTYQLSFPSDAQWSYRGLQPDLFQVINKVPKDLEPIRITQNSET